MATHPPVTASSPEALAGSAPASPGNRPSVSLKQLPQQILSSQRKLDKSCFSLSERGKIVIFF